MADDTTNGDTTDDAGQDSSVIKALRKQIADLTSERDDLRADARRRAFVDAGITEAGRKAMDRLYDGDLEVDAVRAFAEDNGITVTADDTDTTDGGGDPDAAVPDVEQARRDAQHRAAQAHALGATPPPATPADELNDRIAKAATEGNQAEVFRLKSEQIQRLRAGV